MNRASPPSASRAALAPPSLPRRRHRRRRRCRPPRSPTPLHRIGDRSSLRGLPPVSVVVVVAALLSLAVAGGGRRRRADALSAASASPSPPAMSGSAVVGGASVGADGPPGEGAGEGGGGGARWRPRPLPSGPLVIGYSHDPAGPKVRRAIESGVNVVIWSFLHLVLDPSTSRPAVRTDLDPEAMRAVRSESGWGGVVHVGAVGGWNAPHIPPGFGAEEWAEALWEFNVRNGRLLDGFDWDLEGHDDRAAPTSRFDLETLDLVADASAILKRRYGMLVSMAPAESYLDALAEDSSFGLDLNLFPRPWDRVAEDRNVVEGAGFSHAGRQCYAYLWHRAGGADVFGWVAVQLYEAYSRFLHETTRAASSREREEDEDDAAATAQAEGVVRRTVAFFDGFDVDLPVYGTVRISVPPSKLVYGFANGWADGEKFVRVRPRALRDIFVRLKIGGVMFWTIEEEGTAGVYLADDIARALEESEGWGELNHMDDDEWRQQEEENEEEEKGEVEDGGEDEL